MRYQIDLLLKEIETNKTAENAAVEIKERMRDAKRLMRQYAVYHSQAVQSGSAFFMMVTPNGCGPV